MDRKPYSSLKGIEIATHNIDTQTKTDTTQNTTNKTIRSFLPSSLSEMHSKYLTTSKLTLMLLIYIVLFYFGYSEEVMVSSNNVTYVDLTHPFNNKTLYWPVFKPFELDVQHRGMSGDFWYVFIYFLFVL